MTAVNEILKMFSILRALLPRKIVPTDLDDSKRVE